MLRTTWTVFRKEALDAVRDRRSLIAGLLYGVWGPLVMALAVVAIARDRDVRGQLRLAIDGPEHAASLVSFLEQRSVEVVAAPDDVQHAIRQRSLPIALVLTPEYGKAFQRLREAPVALVFDGSWPESKRLSDRVRALLEAYAAQVGSARLLLRGIAPEAATPLEIVEQDFSTAESRASMVLATLPIFLLISTFVGGMGIASDTAAGERERHSLESLLTHPISRASIVTGKWAAVAGMAITTTLLTLLVSQWLLGRPALQAVDLPIGLVFSESMVIAGVLLPLGLMAPAIQLLMAMLAHTFKEAQTHLSVLLFVPMVPGFLFAFGAVDSATWMHWTPVLGQHLALADVLRGRELSLAASATLAAVTIVSGAVVLAVAVRLLERESILHGQRG